MKLIKDFDPSSASSGTIETNGVNPDEQLMLYNDSPIGFRLDFADGSYDIMPPSWNKDFIIKKVPMGKVKWTVYNQLIATGWPISQVYGTVYEPGEHVASVNAAMQRGVTSTGGSVATVGATLSNEGAPINTLIFDTGPAGNLNMIQIFNDHFIWSVVIAGVAHQVLKGNTAGNPLQIGQVGDNSEILGTLIANLLSSSAATDMSYNVPTAQAHRFKVNGVDEFDIDSAFVTLRQNPAYFNSAAGDFILNLQTGNAFRFRINNVDVATIDAGGYNIVGSSAYNYLAGRIFRGRTGHSAVATATITHGLGVTPQIVLVNTDIAQPGSGNCGAGSLTATTFAAAVAGGTAFWWYCSSS